MPKTIPPPAIRTSVFLGLVCSLSAGLAWAQIPNDLERRTFSKPELSLPSSTLELADTLSQMSNRAAWEGFLTQRGDNPKNPANIRVWIDPRSGVAANILASEPLIPGTGTGNHLALADLSRTLGRPVTQVDPVTVGALVR